MPTVAPPAHGTVDPVLLENVPKRPKGVLAFPVTVKHQLRLFARMASEFGRAQSVNHDSRGHVSAQRSAHQLQAKQVFDSSQNWPALFGGNEGNVTYPNLVWLGNYELTLTQVWRDRQILIAVCRRLEARLAFGPDAACQ